MSYSTNEAIEKVDKIAERCQERDGDCIKTCPFEKVKEKLCPFEDYTGAIDYLMMSD